RHRSSSPPRPTPWRSGSESPVIDEILADFGAVPAHSGVVVDSPPGAGKSTLVVRASRALVAGGERLMVVAQTNEQVDDLIDRLAGEDPSITIGRLSAAGYVAAQRVAKHESVLVSGAVGDVSTRSVTIGTAAKW